MKKTNYQKKKEHQEPSLNWGFGKYKPQDYWGNKCGCRYQNIVDGKCKECGGVL